MILINSYNYDVNGFIFNFIAFNNLPIFPYRCHFQNYFTYHVNVNVNVHGRFSFIFRFNFLLFLVIVLWVK